MKYIVALLLAAALLAPGQTTGDWKVLKLVGSTPISAMSDQEAAKLVGSTLKVTNEEVKFRGESYAKPALKVSKTARSTFYKGYKMDGNPLKLPPTISTEDLGCTTLVHLSSGKAIFYWDGYFYSAALVQKPQ